MFGFSEGGMCDAVIAKLDDVRTGKGHQNGRVGGDDKLAILLYQLMNAGDQRHEPGG